MKRFEKLGRVYHCPSGNTYKQKSDAKKRAKAIKKRGELARIVKVKAGYQVWEASK